MRRRGGWGKKDNYTGVSPCQGTRRFVYTSETLIQEKTSKFVQWLVYCHVTEARSMHSGYSTRSVIPAS
jgi:hypothetical protein